MFQEDEGLHAAVEEIRALTLKLKTMKNSAALRNLTDIRPCLFVATRWSGKYYIINKFLKLRESLLLMHRDPDYEFELSQLLRSVEFKERVQNYKKMLGYIEEATRALKKRHSPGACPVDSRRAFQQDR
jgi:hypothetical protein